MYCQFLKPLIDYCLSLILLLLNSPLLVSITIINTIATNGNPFFLHTRPGKGGRPFRMIKFRTLLNNGSVDGSPVMTRFGLFLRKTSLDELPQLINVLKGEMSLAGPRPLLTEYLALYNEEQSRRHDVKPGMTGWAQVNGGNAISWDERFKLDLYYVEHVSFLLDMKIFAMTVLKILSGKEAARGGGMLCPKFTGNPRHE
ncbi:MAG TPA: sugar transferase [Lentimicrobium sp.]|nr:sugar transferase [Lentimicrobium sp.]